MVGAFLTPSDEQMAKGFVGLSAEAAKDNLFSKYTTDAAGKQHSFFTVFAVFFPAVTGIVAGANLSGDLKVLFYYSISLHGTHNSVLRVLYYELAFDVSCF